MSEPFVGEIRMFAGNFAPRSWAFCDGQLLAVSQNDALFSLLGTIYGGDGRTTFGLPDMRGRIAIHAGAGGGLSNQRLGAKGGAESVTLNNNQLSSHSHSLTANDKASDQIKPAGHGLAQGEIYAQSNPSINLNASAITNTGGGRSHSNLMPTVCVHYIIALFGIYPSRQ